MITYFCGPLSFGRVVSVLVAGRFIVSVPWGIPVTGRYYWEHCHYVDTDDFPNLAQMNLAVLADMGLLYTNQVNFNGCRWYLPGTTTVVHSVTYPSFQKGGQSAQPNFNLLVAARWHMVGDDGQKSYHLHRQPIGEDYLTQGEWSALGQSQGQTRINTFIGQGIYRSKTGSLLVQGNLAPHPANWQLRHGTKRRASKFWLP